MFGLPDLFCSSSTQCNKSRCVSNSSKLESKRWGFAYVTPDGGHQAETVDAADPTAAALSIRERLKLKHEEFEVVAVASGRVAFELVDGKRLALAPYSVTSP